MAAERLGEFDRIDRLLKPLATRAEALSLQDDAALLPDSGDRRSVVTTDAMIEGVHFLPGTSPSLLARKLLRVNLSDIAAMGARPTAYVLTLGLPTTLPTSWIEAFADGLREDQAAFGLSLLGGDSVSVPKEIMLSLTAFGEVPEGCLLLRNAARVGDVVCVTGTPGDAALGLCVAQGRMPDLPPDAAHTLEMRYHLPEPRVAFGQSLAGLANAAMDLSDGIAGDAVHIARASGVSIVVEADRFPFSDAARRAFAGNEALRRIALAGGDDYELLFTVAPGRLAAVHEAASRHAVAVAEVGRVVAGDGVSFIEADGTEMADLSGWQHF